jgi:hypothetical protein
MNTITVSLEIAPTDTYGQNVDRLLDAADIDSITINFLTPSSHSSPRFTFTFRTADLPNVADIWGVTVDEFLTDECIEYHYND